MRPALTVVVACVALTIIAIGLGGATRSNPHLAAHVEAVSEAPFGHGLFVHAGGETWYQPLAVYPSALLRTAGVAPHAALLIPSMFAAYVVVWLTYALAVGAGLSQRGAAVALALLVATPGFFLAAGAAGGASVWVATILAWCVAVVHYVRHRRRHVLILGAAALTMGVYTTPAGVLAVPLMFSLGAVVLRRAGAAWPVIVSAGLAVGVVLLPAILWVVLQPAAYPDTFGRWAIHAAHVRRPLDGLLAFTRWHVVARRVSDYWNYFAPTFLFWSGHLFPLWLAILLPLGWWKRPATPAMPLVAGTLLLTPIAATMLDTAREATAVLPILPFGAVLGAIGVIGLTGAPRRSQIVAVAGLAICVILQLTGPGK